MQCGKPNAKKKLGMIEIQPICGDIRNGLLLGLPHHPNFCSSYVSIMSRGSWTKKQPGWYHSLGGSLLIHQPIYQYIYIYSIYMNPRWTLIAIE